MTGDVNATIKTASSVLNKPILNVGTAETALMTTLRPLCIQSAELRGNQYCHWRAGVTYATAVIVLAAGDVWREETAPGAAWVAISDAAGGVLKVQELIA
jgi:hypothetical protein